MPAYLYECLKCNHKFDIVKSIRSFDDPEDCVSCKSAETRRLIQRCNFNGASDWDKTEYNPGLGCITRNAKDRERKAKQLGLIEIGNEDVSKITAAGERDMEKSLDQSFEDRFKPVGSALYESLKKKGS